MKIMGTASLSLEQSPLGALAKRAQPLFLWLTVFASGFVMFEPSPYEFFFLLLVLTLMGSTPRLPMILLPMIVLLVLYNIGGLIATVQVLGKGGERNVITYTAISFYLAITLVIFAGLVAQRPLESFRIIRHGYMVAAALVALTGIVGYFNVAGLGDIFTLYGRAKGTFKDPNVFGPFLILPIVLLVQDIWLGSSRHKIASLLLLGLLLTGLFLSFSRGAWGLVIICLGVMTYLMFLASADLRTRGRIILWSVLGVLMLALMVVGLLSVPQVRQAFLERAALTQDYDKGENGRFARQRKAIPLLLDKPLGLGPYQFGKRYGEDPHNVYLNGFAAYGWLGGISYILLVLLTLAVGARYLFSRTPWQFLHIAVFSVFLGLVLEGFLVDTDHWRHFYLTAGLLWGLSAATHATLRSP